MGYSQDVRIPGVSDFKKGVYCQQCGYGIWIALQSAQFCSGCGFGIHRGCMENIMRTCVAIKAKTQPDFIMDICPERMLPQLKYRCVECDKKFSTSRQPRYVLNFSTILVRTQCGNGRIFLTLRFYVKSIVEILEVLKLLFLPF